MPTSDGSGDSPGGIYRDGAKYDKCKWERAWGEFNAALHARLDSNAFLGIFGDDDQKKNEAIEDIIETFDEIAEKHNVEAFDECWNGEIEECDDHDAVPGGDE